VTFAKGSGAWLAVPVLLTVALAVPGLLLGLPWLAALALLPFVVFLLLAAFFRDPDRATADGVASPADGKVVRLDEVDDADVGRAERIAVFMSPRDVHVNRFPLDGRVVSVRHVAGGHIPAFDKDAHTNERVETVLETPMGQVKMVQIAGAVARRIVPYVATGDAAVKGARMGLIRLGSRCDLLVPPGSVRWSVSLGDKVLAGSTSLATILPASARASTAAKPQATTATTGKRARKAAKPKAPARKSKGGRA